MDFPLTKQVAEKYGHTPSEGWKHWMNNWAESNEKLLEDTLRGWITDDVENSLNLTHLNFPVKLDFPKDAGEVYVGDIKPNVIYLLQKPDGEFIMYIPVEGEPIKNQGLALPIYGYYFNLNKHNFNMELRKHFKIKTTAVANLHSPENTTYFILYGTRPLDAFSVIPDNPPRIHNIKGYKLIGYYEPLVKYQFMNWTSNPLEE